MFLRLFKSNRPAVVILLPLIVILAWLPGFSDTSFVTFPFDSFPAPLYKPLIDFCTSHIVVSKIISLFLLFMMSILMVRLNIRYFFIPERTYMPAFIYLMITSGVIMLQRCTPVLFASLILLLVFYRIFESYKYQGIAYHYFDTALMVSFSGLIYFNSLFFIIFIWLGLIILRTPKWREWVFSIIGFILPFLFLMAYYYFFDKDLGELSLTFRTSIIARSKMISDTSGLVVFLVVLALIFLVSSFFMLNKYDTKKIHARKFFLYFFWVFALSVMLYFIVPSFGVDLILIIAIPVTFLISHYFVFARLNFFTRFIFSLLILSVFWVVYQSVVLLLIK
ncbi:MAG: hypothetical protein JXB00_20620 [Bacteroidales bacterium]|nr:hypothetical protein [Bacteroidales bacterium]